MGSNIKSLILLTLYATTINAGIGDIAGGSSRDRVSNSSRESWKRISRSNFVNWPVVRYSKNKAYEINKLCIKDKNTLATIKPVKKHKLIFKDFKFQRILISSKRKEMPRVFDHTNCRNSYYPNCSLSDQYVEKSVDVPILRNWSNEDENNFYNIHTRNIIKIKKYEIPSCM
jgi:hypothetical protein